MDVRYTRRDTDDDRDQTSVLKNWKRGPFFVFENVTYLTEVLERNEDWTAEHA